MTAGNEFRETNLIEALNEDIERELRVSDEYIARALAAGGLRADAARRHSAECAAAAMRHATTLAAEVLHLGGVPPQFAPRDLPGSGDRLAGAAGLFCRYRQRLRMANALGLFRLEEALREIIRDLRVRSQTRGRMFRLIRIS